MTDEELVARAREGDTAAFGELVLRHQSAVYRAALAAAGASDADDVAQEAFLLAFTRLQSFRGAASFKTWLLTITWNQAINRRRANTRWWQRIVTSVRKPRRRHRHEHVHLNVAHAGAAPRPAN